jgi:hypothetical protein
MRPYVVAVLACLGPLCACTLLNSMSGLIGPPVSPDGGLVEQNADSGHTTASPHIDAQAPSQGRDAGGSRADGSVGISQSDDAGTASETGGPPNDAAPAWDGGAMALYTGRTSPLGVGVHSGTICWVEGQTAWQIMCGPTAGGTEPQVVATSTDDPTVDNAFDVAMDDTYYYWSNGPNNKILRKAINNGTSEQYFTGDNWVSYIVLGDQSAPAGGTSLWVSDWGNGGSEHVVVGPSGSNGVDSMLVFTDSSVAGVAVYTGSVYWGSSSSYVAFGLEGGNVTATQVATSGAVTGLAIDQSTGIVYCIVNSQQIYKFASDSSQLTLMYDAGSSFGVSDLAVDDAVYWSENGNGQIMRMAK